MPSPRPPQLGEHSRAAQAARATRNALVAVARELFASRGFAATSLEDLTARAGVTKGALYHHFGSKEGLFRAVLEQIEADVLEAVGAAAGAEDTPFAALLAAQRRYLTLCRDPAVHRVVLLDAPSVLGAQVTRELTEGSGLLVLERLLTAAMDAGQLRREPVAPLARVLLGALSAAGLAVAEASAQPAPEDAARAGQVPVEELYVAALDRLVGRLATDAG